MHATRQNIRFYRVKRVTIGETKEVVAEVDSRRCSPKRHLGASKVQTRCKYVVA